jgi:hypothetical protein
MSLTFATLDTGDVARAVRADVDDAAVQHAGAVLRRALLPPKMPASDRELLPGDYVHALDVALAVLHPAELGADRVTWRRGPLSGWTLRASLGDGGASLLATAYRPASVSDEDMMAPVATFGIACDDFAGETLWRLLHEDGHGRGAVNTDPDRPPPAPWLGVRLEIGAALPAWERQALDLAALADMQRLIAWAWLEARS